MFETSVDLMYGVIALSILIFTGFLAWIMYYIVQILKQGNEVIAEVRQKIAEVEEAIGNIREKMMSSAASITFIASQIGTIVEAIKSRNDKKSAAGRKK